MIFFGLVLRLSSRLFHILIADGIHGLVETFVQVNGVEKISDQLGLMRR